VIGRQEMAKRVPALSSAQVANIKRDPEKVVELVDGAVPGLRLRVTPAGTKTWSLNVRAAGVMRRFDVGAGLGLADARRKAEELRRQVRQGIPDGGAKGAEGPRQGCRAGNWNIRRGNHQLFRDGAGGPPAIPR
jgi:Arm DNA-binding domain